MKEGRVFIAGAGGFAIEVYNWYISSKGLCAKYDFAGFIDDYAKESRILERLGLDGTLDNSNLYKIKDYSYKKGDRILLAVGSPQGKRDYVQSLSLPSSVYLGFVHESSIVGPNTSLGDGVIVGPMCMIESNIKIGSFSSLNVYSFVAHDVSVGSFCSLSPRSTLLGGCHVGNDCFIGAGAVINIQREIGNNVFVGMNSSVIHNIKDNAKVYGVPATDYKKQGA